MLEDGEEAGEREEPDTTRLVRVRIRGRVRVRGRGRGRARVRVRFRGKVRVRVIPTPTPNPNPNPHQVCEAELPPAGEHAQLHIQAHLDGRYRGDTGEM